MTKRVQSKNGLSGETTKVTLFYDGEKYKDPVFVGINGMNWVIKRGIEVEVPVEVAAVLHNQEVQDKRTARMMRELSSHAKEMLT